MSAYRSPPVELPYHEYLRQWLAGDPDIELFPAPPRLAKLAWPIHGEAPLVLLDDTVMHSLKAGFLLTTHSLYTLGDGRRIDVTTLRGGPHYPRGTEQPGYLDTTAGPFPFAAIGTAETRGRLERLVDVVCAYGRGDRSSPYEALARRGPVSYAATTTLLASKDVIPPWGLPAQKRDGLHLFSHGMDHIGGEEPLAVIDETSLGACDEGVIFTDRALRVRNENASEGQQEYVVRYTDLVHASFGSVVFGRSINLRTTQRIHELQLIKNEDAVDHVMRFLGAVMHLPPHARYEPRPPGNVGDAMLHAYITGLALPQEIEADFRQRVLVQHMNERWGRGDREGWAISPLSLADLRFALGTVLGPPMMHPHWDGRIETADFSLHQRGPGAGAVASSVVGIALLATVGIGWISVPRGPTITSVRVRTIQMAGGAGMSVTGFAGRVESHAPQIAERIDDKLFHVEHEIMRRRCILGPSLPCHELFAVDDATLAARAAALVTASSSAGAAGQSHDR